MFDPLPLQISTHLPFTFSYRFTAFYEEKLFRIAKRKEMSKALAWLINDFLVQSYIYGE